VATPSGVVQTVRAGASIGARLAGTRVVGHATRARLHGIVIKRIGSLMFLSSNHHLLAVHTGRRLADAAPPTARTAAPSRTRLSTSRRTASIERFAGR
jgi:hypothetical protein